MHFSYQPIKMANRIKAKFAIKLTALFPRVLPLVAGGKWGVREERGNRGKWGVREETESAEGTVYS